MEADSWRIEDIDLLKRRNRNCNSITAEDLPVKPVRAPGAGMALQNSASLNAHSPSHGVNLGKEAFFFFFYFLAKGNS